MNNFGELARSLSRVTAQLIDLAGSGLHNQNRIVFHGLVDGRIDDPGMRGADRIHSPFSGDAIAVYDILQGGGRTAATLLNHWLQTTLLQEPPLTAEFNVYRICRLAARRSL